MMECASSSHSPHTLIYVIHNWSSYSGNYHPSNILLDRPHDQSSRWSSDSNYPPQFVSLKLQHPAVVTEITFGKYEKTHVCNLQKFKVYGGLNEDHMVELLTDGLKNDSTKETFVLQHELQGNKFPCKFVKIVPLMSWGTSFNFSIWHIQLTGIDDASFVHPRLKWFNNYREQEAIRLCLKHLRRKNYAEAFDALKNTSKVSFEDPLLTRLHDMLVKCGNFDYSEELIETVGQDGIFQEYVCNQDYQPIWSSIIPLNKNGIQSSVQPGMRGGHQMCLDSERQVIFLLGGWDGMKDLADFWVYDITTGQWQIISENVTADGGPSARSCHKICLDKNNRNLYLLGRYLDSTDRGLVELKSDFYKYDLDTGLWDTVSLDTAIEGGPHLIFDHQMQYDPVAEKIFVFGGRILTSSTHDDHTFEPLFSGLFTYHIPTNSWSKLRDDGNESGQLRARSGHSMLVDERSRLLYIFAGQRGREYLNDFFCYHVDKDEVLPMVTRSGNKELPSAGFTQRSTIDLDRGEIYVLSGLSKDREKREESIQNSFWVYNLKTSKWSCVYKNEHRQQQWSRENAEPRPRFAHQLVYDPTHKVHFLFGGNPGKSTSMKLRLDDFWMLKLERSTVEDIIRHCKYTIRKLRYKELTVSDPVSALSYLQTEIAQLVDHSNLSEREEFESLAASLFAQQSPASSEEEEDEEDVTIDNVTRTPSRVYSARNEVFEELTKYFPLRMVQPRENITDFILV